ncbi:MAG TPA: antibiotic biosynthesis monooxygenase [Mycobacteriales bacterium]|nr:antibiotic biosynthesis monooxygenase [Mycobacteriales bacterium]
MSNFGLVVRFVLRPGHEELFDELVAETLTGIQQEPGTLIYASHSVGGEPQVRIFYELYEDRAAFDAHEAEDHVRRFLKERERHVESFTVDFLGVLGAKGVPAGESA